MKRNNKKKIFHYKNTKLKFSFSIELYKYNMDLIYRFILGNSFLDTVLYNLIDLEMF